MNNKSWIIVESLNNWKEDKKNNFKLIGINPKKLSKKKFQMVIFFLHIFLKSRNFLTVEELFQLKLMKHLQILIMIKTFQIVLKLKLLKS